MSFSEKEVIGILSVILDAIAHAPYIRMTVTKKTRPHMFSWIIWTLTIGIAFAAQLSDNAGPGAWSMGLAMVISFTIVILSIFFGEKDITLTDCLSFSTALAAIPLWCLTKNPLWAVLLVTFIDATGYYPTMRKAYSKPWEESRFLYGIAAIDSLLCLFALENVSLITALFPAMMMVCNGLLTMELFWRRHALKNNA